MYKSCIIIILTLSLISCQAQTSYKELEKKIDSTIPQEYYKQREELIKIGNELSAYLPSEHSKKGNVDYTKELQRGVDKGGVLLLPDYPLMVNEKGLQLKSNTKLVFRKNSKLIMKPNAETHYGVLDIIKVENVDVYFPNIEGDRFKHLSKDGEWGMGIRIHAGETVNIYAPTIFNCWGDGIYVRDIEGVASKNVAIHNFKIFQARRNGISIISANNLILNKGVISETNGTAPQSGIDIEPNRPSDILNNIMIRDVITHNSKGDGIMILLSNLTLKSSTTSNRKVNIYVENHYDVGSKYPVRISGRAVDDNQTGKYQENYKLGGEIIFNNPEWVWNKSDLPVRFSPNKNRVLEYGFNPKVKFKNINIIDENNNISSNQVSLQTKINKESEKL